jgi:hypothetical protein
MPQAADGKQKKHQRQPRVGMSVDRNHQDHRHREHYHQELDVGDRVRPPQLNVLIAGKDTGDQKQGIAGPCGNEDHRQSPA